MQAPPHPAGSVAADRLELVIANRLPELARVFAAVDEVARGRVPAEAADDLKVALDEILSNVMAHGYTDGAAHEIRVTVGLAGAQIVAHVEDDGVAFDPLAVPAPDLAAQAGQRPLGGLGIHLVRGLMSDIQYQRIAGRNVLRLARSFA